LDRYRIIVGNNGRKEVRSFCIVYGEIVPRRFVDVEIALNVFADIDDKEEAKRIGEQSRWEGPGSVIIEILGS
jgi:hypothetical protein